MPLEGARGRRGHGRNVAGEIVSAFCGDRAIGVVDAARSADLPSPPSG
jgi:hypothetical protein